MAVVTKKVTNRREVHYDTIDDLLEDAQRLAASEVETVGNWSLGQILKHLGTAFHIGIDGAPLRPSWFVRTVARMFLKKRFLTKPLPAGFQLPATAAKKLVAPDTTTTEEGLDYLQKAIERWRSDPTRAPNSLFGELTKEQHDEFQLRHAELHMSFVRPAGGG